MLEQALEVYDHISPRSPRHPRSTPQSQRDSHAILRPSLELDTADKSTEAMMKIFEDLEGQLFRSRTRLFFNKKNIQIARSRNKFFLPGFNPEMLSDLDEVVQVRLLLEYTSMDYFVNWLETHPAMKTRAYNQYKKEELAKDHFVMNQKNYEEVCWRQMNQYYADQIAVFLKSEQFLRNKDLEKFQQYQADGKLKLKWV